MNQDTQTSLLHLLSNTLILYQTVPYLPIGSLLNLGATSKSFQRLVRLTPGVFRYVDLTNFKSAKYSQYGPTPVHNVGQFWCNIRMEENITEDESLDLSIQLNIH
jgi:hypothetical protein